MICRTVILAFMFIAGLHVAAQRQPSIDTGQIDQFIKGEMNKWRVPGCALAVVNGQDILYSKGYGLRDAENKLPVTPNTVFKIASLTKSFTAAATGLLVEQKILEWNEPVKGYVPQLEFINADLTAQVTLRDLLTHRTGIYDDDWSWVGDHIDKTRMYEILSAMPQKAPIRTVFIYNNMAYALAGQVLAEKSGNSWRNLIRKDFFEPLSMTSSIFSHTDSSRLADFAYGYDYSDSSKFFVRGNLGEHYTDSLSVCEAFGFISSSAMDMSKWVRLFINGGNWKGKQIIPADIFSELIKPVNYMEPPLSRDVSESFYCMGWWQNYYKCHQLIQHSGGLSGFKSYMSFMPHDSIGIIILTNGQPYQFPKEITYDLYDMILDLPKTLWCDKALSEQNKDAAKEIKTVANIAGTNPSKPLKAYAGTYFSTWLGCMRVYYENGDLYFQFHNYPKEKMKHAHYDTFYTEAEREPGKGITFQTNHDGKVTAMLLNEFVFERIK